MTASLRDGVPADRAALIELQRRASLIWDDTRADLLAHPEAIDVPEDQFRDGRVRVLELDGRPIGFSALLANDDGSAELDALFVEPAEMGAGHGRALTDDAVDRARAAGHQQVKVIANKNARGFYERVGFVAVREVDTSFAKALRMHRDVHAAIRLRTQRLVLDPLRVADADTMVAVLADPRLYEFTGGGPLSLDELAARFRAQVAGPGRPGERWHNWIVRMNGEPIGFVQATVSGPAADLAWVIGTPWQGQGCAKEAAAAMCTWLQSRGVESIAAHIQPNHLASAAVAAAIGLAPTGNVDGDGEREWLAS